MSKNFFSTQKCKIQLKKWVNIRFDVKRLQSYYLSTFFLVRFLSIYLSKVGGHSPAAPWQRLPELEAWEWCPEGARRLADRRGKYEIQWDLEYNQGFWTKSRAPRSQQLKSSSQFKVGCTLLAFISISPTSRTILTCEILPSATWSPGATETSVRSLQSQLSIRELDLCCTCWHFAICTG